MSAPLPPVAFSVVIPAYNAGSTLTGCLEALAAQELDPSCYEVIVVDNGSSDQTAELARRGGAQVITQSRRGAAAARNAGIKAARGAIVCFTDADCAPAPDWISRITAPLANPAIVGCKGVYRTHQQRLVARFVQVEYEDKYDRLARRPTIDFVDTYSAAYRRDVLVANGGFDERIFFVEDQELSFRLASRGYQMVFQPSAIVYHCHSATAAAYWRKKFMIGYWKAQIIRRFPNQGIQDSHTPQVMKVQMGLMALMLASLPAVMWSAWAGLLPLVVLIAFLLTTVPFVAKAWSKDRAVTLAAPALLMVRALALGFGYGWGLVRPQPGILGDGGTIGGMNYLAKRLMDLAGAVVGLVVTALVGPWVALAIKLDTPGPILFRQQRVGQGGRPFTVYKFRSMNVDAEAELERLVDLDRLPEPVFKLENDPRVTRVGRFIRRWSLDELPQFWNVLRGEMSLIGPRPEEAWVVARYNDWHRRRLTVKPGITGPMQVSGRADLSLDSRVRLELEYIENYTIWRDLRLLAQTIPAVLFGWGAR
jgi:lipopolysaccharide/colanic/teichoic acid biosynthesis glycosyltransferase/GT2 family glycosyltransferase